jgi:hypothetical protein
LQCYIARAMRHPAWGVSDESGDFVADTPALPTGNIKADTLKLLIEAYPPALTHNLTSSALKLLCKGCSVSLELMKLLIDDGGVVLSAEGRDTPLWSLLYNKSSDTFPSDVFRYLLNHTSSDLIYTEEGRDILFDHKESSLTVACSKRT